MVLSLINIINGGTPSDHLFLDGSIPQQKTYQLLGYPYFWTPPHDFVGVLVGDANIRLLLINIQHWFRHEHIDIT